ncbi:tryptophan synthase beta subunit-like PLP-dependent enzyme [Pleomassaria siparia CBS 279.74]|uniref:Threonine synthase n=1 Tax=Pleomassaria siparia CBS 279.74 TaxID=1314801 RepID=A0A6G1JV33_9PLEO|nr:tryptophan synthase beta subunit-like PLP-dependent enzyme [Pleomassaria siparia CBS 279.74]
MSSHTASQRYLSTRGGSYDLSFEQVVLKGLASDGGLFIPEEIPTLPKDWASNWQHLSFEHLAYEIFSLYISPSEIPAADLKGIIHRSYSTFRVKDITPTVTLDEKNNIHLLELFHGPTFAFKDVALQFLGNLFEYFLVRRNENKTGRSREHLTVVGATSGDTGSAAIYGLRGKKDVSVFIMHPQGKVSAVQEAQMTTVMDANVHNLAVDGTFDDCQDFVKALFADPEINKTHRLAAVNSINWARILAQITYYFYSYFQLIRQPSFLPASTVRFVVPTGNFGDILAGYFAKRMGLPAEKLVVATNENDILHRFWQSGKYEKQPVHGKEAEGGIPEDGVKADEGGVKETLSPAMDILVSSNFERLLWFLAYEVYSTNSDAVSQRRAQAGDHVRSWLNDLKTEGGFRVDQQLLKAAQADFESYRVSDEETLETIKDTFASASSKGYVLDPHSAIGVHAAYRSAKVSTPPSTHHIALATAHPAKFSNAVERALSDENDHFQANILPDEFKGLEDKPRRVSHVRKADGWEGVRRVVIAEVEAELQAAEKAANSPSHSLLRLPNITRSSFFDFTNIKRRDVLPLPPTRTRQLETDTTTLLCPEATIQRTTLAIHAGGKLCTRHDPYGQALSKVDVLVLVYWMLFRTLNFINMYIRRQYLHEEGTLNHALTLVNDAGCFFQNTRQGRSLDVWATSYHTYISTVLSVPPPARSLWMCEAPRCVTITTVFSVPVTRSFFLGVKLLGASQPPPYSRTPTQL